jgi:hypothetical protein
MEKRLGSFLSSSFNCRLEGLSVIVTIGHHSQYHFVTSLPPSLLWSQKHHNPQTALISTGAANEFRSRESDVWHSVIMQTSGNNKPGF